MVKQGLTMHNNIVLGLLTLAFIVGELSHFLIGPMNRAMARDIHYGPKECFRIAGVGDKDVTCADQESENQCLNLTLSTGDGVDVQACEFVESGLGLEYQILAGPIFVVIFTTSGIVFGFFGDKVQRFRLLSFCILLYSSCGCLMAFATEYWHLVVLRMGVAAGEASLRPVAGALLAELYDPATRGVANGIFSWGVYIGYGFTFLLGNYVPEADILDFGWRPVYIIGCFLGLPVAISLFFFKDPKSEPSLIEEKKPGYGTKETELEASDVEVESSKSKDYLKTLIWSLIQPSMILLLVAACTRHTGGYSWAYNTQQFFDAYHEDVNPGVYLAMCSIIGGSFGVFVGGWLSDMVVKRFGLYTRLWLLAMSTLIATPFSIGVLTLPAPWTFVMLLIYYFFSETWFAILFTVIVEIVPNEVRAVCIGIFLFVMNNVGGNLPVAIEPVHELLGYRKALLIFFSGSVGLSSILFFIAGIPLYIEHKRRSTSVATS